MISASTVSILAWIPFVQPLPLHDQWMWLLLPLAFVIALVYKALKLPTLDDLAFQTLRTAAMIIGFMVAAAAVLWIVTEAV